MYTTTSYKRLTTFGLGLGLGLGLLASCTSLDDTSRIESAIDGKIPVEKNDLGITMLVTEQIEENGNTIYTLHALGEGGDEIASVQLVRGEIPDLLKVFPGDYSQGSDIVIRFAKEDDSRTLTRAWHRLDLVADGRGEHMAQFLTLPEVTKTLEGDANVFVKFFGGPVIDQPPFPPASWTDRCPPEFMNVTPLARECGYYTEDTGLQSTFHIGTQTIVNGVPTQSAVQKQTNVMKVRNPTLRSCRGTDGLSLCTGQLNATNPHGCYYGPNGFAPPVATLPPVPGYFGHTQLVNLANGNSSCSGIHTYRPLVPQFPNTDGAFALGGGCCNGQPTLAGEICCNGAVLPAGSTCKSADGGADSLAWDY